MTDQPTLQTHLFLVRVWREERDGGAVDFRGQAQHVLTGEMRGFRDWATLVEFLSRQSERPPPGSAESAADDER